MLVNRLKFKTFIFVLMAGGVACCVTPAQAMVTYNYEGLYFTEVNGVFSTTDRITGYVSFDDYIPNSTLLTNFTSEITDYNFSDGFETYTGPFAVELLSFGTDEFGNINDWSIHLNSNSIGVQNGVSTFLITNTTYDWVSHMATHWNDPDADWAKAYQGQELVNGWTGGPESGNTVPEPSSILLVGLGVAGTFLKRKFS